jgi:RNA polymerase sigma factor (sigma-70 family)
MTRVVRRELNRLVSRLVDGDRHAFDPVFEALWPILSAFAQRFLADAPGGEDAAQLALMKIFSRAGSFDPSRDALSWALVVTTWECRTIRARTRRRRETGTLPELVCAGSPERELIDHDLRRALDAVLAELPEADRMQLESDLREDNGGKIPAPTIRKRRQRALGRLRAVWRARHGT